MKSFLSMRSSIPRTKYSLEYLEDLIVCSIFAKSEYFQSYWKETCDLNISVELLKRISPKADLVEPSSFWLNVWIFKKNECLLLFDHLISVFEFI